MLRIRDARAGLVATVTIVGVSVTTSSSIEHGPHIVANQGVYLWYVAVFGAVLRLSEATLQRAGLAAYIRQVVGVLVSRQGMWGSSVGPKARQGWSGSRFGLSGTCLGPR
jgi:hypothetical protein